MNEFALPDVGEGLAEAEVVEWRVKIGDSIIQDQIVVEIETAKSLVELPSPFAGTVVALFAVEGEVVAVGSPLMRVEAIGPLPAVNDPSPAELATGELPTVGEPVLVGYGTKVVAERTRRIQRPGTVAPTGTLGGLAVSTHSLAKPPVRLLAKQMGLNLNDVARSTPSSIVRREDVLRASERVRASSSNPDPAVTDWGDVSRPIRGVLKATADAVTRSAFTAPHASLSLTVDLTRSLRIVEELRRDPVWAESRPSMLLLVAKALLLAVTENPEINSSWDEANQEIHTKSAVNLGIAAATPRGLMVPNIKAAQALSLRDLGVALASLITQAREGKATPADMAGGTITITNIGSLGVDSGSPILNPGEAAILAFGSTVKRPWVVGKKIKIRDVATFTLTFDHRLVNGDLGARVITMVGKILARPNDLWRHV
jgi:2-oxoisovalerate dehydrogenase E2 component (dihydrolipoyl transacylase)